MTEEGGGGPNHQVMPRALVAADGTGSLIIRRCGCSLNTSPKLWGRVQPNASQMTRHAPQESLKGENLCLKTHGKESYQSSSHISDTEHESLYFKLQTLWRLLNEWIEAERLHAMNERRWHRAHAPCRDVQLHVLSYLWHRAEPSPEARRSARLSTSTSPGSTWRTARFAAFGSGLFYHQITKRMTIKNKTPCSHVSRRERGVQAQTTSIVLVLFFSGLVDLRHGTNRRVPCWFWSRLTPSRSGGLHPLLTAAPAQIHGPHGSGSNKKRSGGRSWERGRKKQSPARSEVAFTDPGPSRCRSLPAGISAQSPTGESH